MIKPLKVVADENMPHLDLLFSDFAQLTKMPGRSIHARHLRHADALLCRSVTAVGYNLLSQSPIKFVGSATIGTDHLQIAWLEQQGIAWANAAGCNAGAVAQYVISGISHWLKQELSGKRCNELVVGIIGAGNVGSELARCLSVLGIQSLLYDPPLARASNPGDFVSIERILQCDVISIHVPLTRAGKDPTFHLINADFMAQLTEKQLVINAARGGVIDNHALLNYLEKPKHAAFILDVFEREPAIDFQLARQCLLATPHIAGHTLEGKSRGSFMIYQAFCQHFNIKGSISLARLFPENNQLYHQGTQLNDIESLLTIYDIKQDGDRLLSTTAAGMAEHFDNLRKYYALMFNGLPRRDYSGWNGSGTFSSNVNKLLD